MIKISIRSRVALHRETRAPRESVAYAALRRVYPLEMASLLRCTCRGAAPAARAFLAGGIFFVAACADTPPEYNPIEWGRSLGRGVGSMFEGPPPEAEPPAAEGRSYPNLASVPRPPKVTPRAQRDAELARLQADQQAAAAADQALRADGTFPVAPSPPAVSEPPAAPAAPVMAAPVPTATPAARAPVSAPVAAPVQPAAAVAAAVPATLRRVGAVAFARDGSAVSAAGERALGDAAALARANNGRVRLIPAQLARLTPPLELARARNGAILQVLSRAGLARDRVLVDDGAGRRVDVYDLYVEF